MAPRHTLLSKDEVVVRRMRTHVKAILPNILGEILLIVAGILASVYLPYEWSPFSHAFVWAAVVVATIPLLLVPVLKWATTTFTLTSKRIITRHGIFNKKGHDLPLTRISDVAMDRDLVDRMLGCGTLTLQTSANDPLVLADVPHIEYVQLEITNLLFHDVQGAVDADPEQAD